METIGSILKRQRTAKGLTQKALAKRIDMSPVQLCKIENRVSTPSIRTGVCGGIFDAGRIGSICRFPTWHRNERLDA
jgi:DNA-binding XRE family transcriptional regulator